VLVFVGPLLLEVFALYGRTHADSSARVEPTLPPPEGTLLQLAGVGGTFGLFTVDLATGKMTQLADFPTIRGISVGTAVLNNINHKYYFAGYDALSIRRLYTVDTENGNILSKPLIDDAAEVEVDTLTDTLYGLAGISGSFHLVTFDPSMGDITSLGDLGLTNVNLCTSALDSANHRYFVVSYKSGTKRVYVVDTVNGTIITSSQIGDLMQPEFDDTMGVLYGLAGVSGIAWFVAIDPMTGDVTMLGSLPSVRGVTMGSSALDQVNHRYFFSGINGSGTKRLFVVDTQTRTLISNPVLSPLAFPLANELDIRGCGFEPVSTPIRVHRVLLPMVANAR